MSFFKKMIHAFSGKKYRKNPNGSTLTNTQYSALNIGAINAEQTMYFCDSLETGGDKSELAENLEAYYSIFHSASAIETLDWLKNRGHRIYFEAIKQFVSDASTAIHDTILEEEEKVRTYEFIRNLNDTTEELLENNYISQRSELADLSILAWDMGRLVLLSRCCYDLGYLSEEVAWSYIMDAQKQCQQTYSDWKEFADGYLVGRSMWSGSNVMLQGLMDIASGLLQDDNSPWLQYPLK